jgi:hypothetical protein
LTPASALLFLALSAILLSAPAMAQEDYAGTLRLFVVEPESRWTDGLGVPYNFGFIDYALVEILDIKDVDFWNTEFVWNAQITGHAGIEADNLAMAAVVFNAEGITTDAFPPYGHWFEAYYVDASAMAYPNVPGHGDAALGFTHMPFLELAGSSG